MAQKSGNKRRKARKRARQSQDRNERLCAIRSLDQLAREGRPLVSLAVYSMDETYSLTQCPLHRIEAHDLIGEVIFRTTEFTQLCRLLDEIAQRPVMITYPVRVLFKEESVRMLFLTYEASLPKPFYGPVQPQAAAA